nr:hypothetical protein [Tanacetum cinerariifolium]
MRQTHISQASGSGADDEGKDVDDDEDDEGDDDDDEDDDGEEGDDDADQEVVRDDDKDDEKEGRNDEHKFDEDESDKETRDKESFDPIPQTPENSEDEGNGEEDFSLNVGGEERHIEEEEEEELYRDVNINQGRGLQASLEVEDSHVTLTPVNPDGQQQSSSVSSQFVTSMLNRTLDVDTLTPELLAGPTYELMKRSCKSLVELEYHLEEFFKATTDQLDWVNPEGQQYPHNLLKPLPLIPNNRGERKTKKDKIGLKPDKNRRRGKTEKSQKQLQ